MRVCRRCGACLSDRIDWCGQCGSRAGLATSTELVGELTAAWSPYVPAMPARDDGPRPVRRLSRWHGGATSPGPRGRAGITALVAGGWLVPFVLLALTTIGPLFLLAYTILTLPGTVLILRDAWKPDLVVEPPPAATSCAACGTPRRQGARACHVCFSRYDANPAPVHSRTASGPTSFGPAGRFLLSFAIFGTYFAGAIFSAVLGWPTLMVFSVAFGLPAGGMLRAIWRRARVA